MHEKEFQELPSTKRHEMTHGDHNSHIIIRLAVEAHVMSPHPSAIPGPRRGVLDPGDEVEHAGEPVAGQHAVQDIAHYGQSYLAEDHREVQTSEHLK